MTTIWWHREPTLEDILSDSITKAVMAADGVDPQELAAALKVVSRSPLRPAPSVAHLTFLSVPAASPS
jgi:hypothetical protein